MMTTEYRKNITNNGKSIWQNTQINIKLKKYNFPNEIWDIIKEYLGIGKHICFYLIKLNTKQLKNIIDCTFRCDVPKARKFHKYVHYNNALVSIFIKQLNSNPKKTQIVKRTQQTINELKENLSCEIVARSYADLNKKFILKIDNNMCDKYDVWYYGDR